MKTERIVRYTAKDLEEKIANGEDRSDWEAAAAMTPEEIDAAIASDPDDAGWDWGDAEWVAGIPRFPSSKQQVTIRVDDDVLDWFRASGKGYQTRINAVLRQFMEHQRKAS